MNAQAVGLGTAGAVGAAGDLSRPSSSELGCGSGFLYWTAVPSHAAGEGSPQSCATTSQVPTARVPQSSPLGSRGPRTRRPRLRDKQAVLRELPGAGPAAGCARFQGPASRDQHPAAQRGPVPGGQKMAHPSYLCPPCSPPPPGDCTGSECWWPAALGLVGGQDLGITSGAARASGACGQNAGQRVPTTPVTAPPC